MFLADLGGVERFHGFDHCHDQFAGRICRHHGSCPVRHFHPLIFMRNQWFIIQTLSGQEHKVKESIEKRIKADEMEEFIKEVMVPMEKVVEVRNNKKTVSNR